MHTGEGDIMSLGRLETWQSRDHTDAFDGECGKVRSMMSVLNTGHSLTLVFRLKAPLTACFHRESLISPTQSSFSQLISVGL